MYKFERKEKNLFKLIEKIINFSLSYSHSDEDKEKIISERDQINLEKKRIEKKNQELIKEHRMIKQKLLNLQSEISKKSDLEDKFNQDINELTQETEYLVNEIEKWRM